MSSDVKGTFDTVERQFEFTPTQDWFSPNIDSWRAIISMVKSTSPRILEIGSWEGRSAVFLLQELCKDDGEIVCIDHFDLMRTPAGRKRYDRIVHNLSLTGKKFRLMDEFSVPALMTLLKEEMTSQDAGFHWIYVDGSHEADDTFLDGELAWRLARKDAIVIFDDYLWDREPLDSKHHPRRGIDCFMKLHEGEYEQISSAGCYQMVLKKTSDIRIGFLDKDKADCDVARALDYGINVVVTADSRYAAAAAVCIRSTVDQTPGRITIYVVNCDLKEDDVAKIRSSVPARDDVTLLFISLPEKGLGHKMGANWAKLDAIWLVPVERVLYLDADILVRASLKSLWNVDLQGREIGAVADVGWPQGHDTVTRGPYFNAGVLLMDLTKIRESMPDLEELAMKLKNSRYRDQDALNVHFRGKWHPLDLTWNAQGLGTYAHMANPNQEPLPLESMANPHIVHFTGPVNPSMAVVLNPYVQPYTAKPWGYAGAPGHPHEEEWWQVLDQTAWASMRDSEEHRDICQKELKGAIRLAMKDFKERIEMNHRNLNALADAFNFKFEFAGN